MDRQSGHNHGVNIICLKTKALPKCSVPATTTSSNQGRKTPNRPAQQMFFDDLAARRLHMVSSVTLSGVSHDDSARLANDISEIHRNCLATSCGRSQDILACQCDMQHDMGGETNNEEA